MLTVLYLLLPKERYRPLTGSLSLCSWPSTCPLHCSGAPAETPIEKQLSHTDSRQTKSSIYVDSTIFCLAYTYMQLYAFIFCVCVCVCVCVYAEL